MADLTYDADELYDAVLFDFDGHAQIPSKSGGVSGLTASSDELHLIRQSDRSRGQSR